MVAYQGGVRFEYRVPERGHGGLLQEGLTGEGVKLMTAAGTGDLFLAHDKRKNMILDLGNERMAVNGDSVLAIDQGIDLDIHRVEGAGRLSGGLFNVVLQRSGNVRTGLRSDVSFKIFTSHGSRESLQMSFESPGCVLILPSEGAVVPPHSHAREGNDGGGIGSFLGGD